MRRILAFLAVLAALATAPAAAWAGDTLPDPALLAADHLELPLAIPERPFLLLEAPRRYGPGEVAEVRVQVRGGGPVRIALYRVHDPLAVLAQPRGALGLAVAATPLGAEMERLVAIRGALPRAGAVLTLVRLERATLVPAARTEIPAGGEAEVYDSFESDEAGVETYWVRADRWSEGLVPLGRLPPGLYVARAQTGAWAAAALLSVGDTVVLARRGDTADFVAVTDRDGAPLAGVRVEARAAGEVTAAASTGADGVARLPSTGRLDLRYVARRGEDVAWADVAHGLLDPCDPRVYLGVGRPVFRPGETVHLRGQVRGCVEGFDRGLPGERVRLAPGTRGTVDVTTDARGNFVAVLTARSEGVTAEVRNRRHHRPLTLDHRALPERSLTVSLSPQVAAAGERVTVRVADADDGWPVAARVQLETPWGTLARPIGPGQPAVFELVAPATEASLSEARLVASVASRGAITLAAASLWTGRKPALLGLRSEATWATEGQAFAVTVEGAGLDGAPVAGEVELALFGSDGNRPVGSARRTLRLRLDAGGRAVARVPLVGVGPWILQARGAAPGLDAAPGSLVVWERPRPPTLSARGDLALQPEATRAASGGAVAVSLRVPAGPGRAWVTLEGGGVWSHRVIASPAGGLTRVELPVPAAASGLATVVAAHVAGGRVRTVSAVVEVTAGERFGLAVTTDRRSYGEGARARVTLTARTPDGRPHDAVVSLWVADAGYWDLGQEDYPPPAELFRLPGRPASAGDSTAPVAFGAEEGRRPDAWMEWQGSRLPDTTFRHAWGCGGELVSLDAAGTLSTVASALAAEAGLRGARVCDRADRRIGAARLRVSGLPWDLVAVRLADRTRTLVAVEKGVLVLECPDEAGGVGSGQGAMRGRTAHAPQVRMGAASGPQRAERLYGTVFFAGLLELGPDGVLELEVPLPAHPGRWRIEALAIDARGGGADGHALATTDRQVRIALGWPDRLAVGDAATGLPIEVTAPGLAGRDVAVSVSASPGLAVAGARGTLRLDAAGAARTTLELRALQPGDASVTVRADVAGVVGAGDVVRHPLAVAPAWVAMPLAARAVFGPGAPVARFPIPALAAPATLDVVVGVDLLAEATAALEALAAPRWNHAVLRLERLVALAALEEAARGVPASRRAALRAHLARVRAGELAALEGLIEDGTVVVWQRGPASARLTAELLFWGRLPPEGRWEGGWELLRAQVDRREVAAGAAPVVAALLARGSAADRARAAALLEGLAPALDDIDARIWVARATGALPDARRHREALRALAAGVEALIARPDEDRAICRGTAWFLCFGAAGDRALASRAATLLLAARAADAEAVARRVLGWLASHPGEAHWLSWGSDDADVLALVARAGARRGHVPFEVWQGGARLARSSGGRATARVAGEGVLEVRAPAVVGAAPVTVTGRLAVSPPDVPLGPARVTRRFEERGGVWRLELEVEAGAPASDVELEVPLPAGLELAREATSADPQTPLDELRGWPGLFARYGGAPTARPVRPRIERSAAAVRFSWGALGPGPLRASVPLRAVATGTYRADPATLRSHDGRIWAIGAADTILVRPDD